MLAIRRAPENPILRPDKDHDWEAAATLNPTVIEHDGKIFMLYRAISEPRNVDGHTLEISSIGFAESEDGVHFGERRQIIKPEFEWEKFGCEDPRVTKFEDVYYIFYTALSTFPFSAAGIKIGVAVTKDFRTFEKHPVTPFNSKAMALFPERIHGKIGAILTVNTDMPPAKICIACMDSIEDLWRKEFWDEWYANFKSHVLPIEENEKDHIELGSPPIKTREGWLLFYSYIYNYFSPPATFGIQAILLDLVDPQRVVGEVKKPFFVPDEDYELYGKVPNIVFPSGALIKKETLMLYYGAADNVCCLATFKLEDLVEQLLFVVRRQLRRFEGNPIISPIREHDWESKATFNPAALYEDGKFHILYRAMSEDNTSAMGYAASFDGVNIVERLPEPAYVPREEFERKLVAGGNSGCEDPRLTRIGDTIYMCYTAFNGRDLPRVAFTSIAAKDFFAKKWNWAKPVLISPPGFDDKDAAVFPKKIKGKYAILHRFSTEIWLDYVDTLKFDGNTFVGGKILLGPLDSAWDSKRVGIAGPPIETKAGWLLLFHGISKRTSHYHIRAALLDLKDPQKILYRTHDPIFEPKTPYEKEGIVSNVVFPCGAVAVKGTLFVYYGAADKVTGVAMIDLKELVSSMVREAKMGKR